MLPSLWVLEGLLPYLAENHARGVLAECAFLAAPESVLFADVVGVSFMRCPWIQPFLRSLETIDAPWQFATDRPEEFFAAIGWRATAKRPGEDGASYGRWPYPAPPPRGTPGMPEIFLVTAMRDGTAPIGV